MMMIANSKMGHEEELFWEVKICYYNKGPWESHPMINEAYGLCLANITAVSKIYIKYKSNLVNVLIFFK